MNVIEKCKARGISEVLRRTLADELAPGDHIVKPPFLCVYSEDKDGYASLRAEAGTRFTVIDNEGGRLTARKIETGEIVSQDIPLGGTLLKVVTV